jgi:hypothetical protein
MMGLWDLIFGHRCGDSNHDFRSRYDEVEMSAGKGFSTPAYTFESLDEQSNAYRKLLMYVKDVCTYCGKEINR